MPANPRSLFFIDCFLFSFCFLQLDPNNPERKFIFELEAEENWNIPVCDPPLPETVLDKLLVELEENEKDMMPFVRGMRRAFVETLENDKS